MSGDVAAGAQVALADRLAGAGVLDAGWRGAFEAVPRHLFLPPVYWEFVDGVAVRRDQNADPEGWLAGAYRDTAAITQWDDGDEAGGRQDFTSSLSMPTMVARMLGDLCVEDGHRVREVGTGPGFNAALLAHRLGADKVVSVEIDEAVAGLARKNLAAAGLGGVRVLVGDGADAAVGAGGRADRLIATCSSLVTDLPVAWIGQTVPGGVIVAPIATLFGGGATARLQVADDGRSAAGRFTGASDFMRMRQQRYQAPPVDAYLPGDWPGDARASVTGLDPESIGGSWLAQFAIGAALPDVYYRRAPYGDMVTWWFFDTAVTSWATVDSVPDRSEFEVRQSGPRRLWDEIHTAWTAWEKAGQPGYERFGLTVTTTGTRTVWLDDPGRPWHPPAH
ncbi:methyltransferase domain-containing protein [Kitasatospora sp. CB01950]|uniref:methyltransferase domain-containing protein n=1 Tax=Kitasatospora sp. CB01950 TaxID=1703930 RepID=UPI0009FACAE2|nr:methyltransferase domain-containing protein [Kitasatospora sp. CB01950]